MVWCPIVIIRSFLNILFHRSAIRKPNNRIYPVDSCGKNFHHKSFVCFSSFRQYLSISRESTSCKRRIPYYYCVLGKYASMVRSNWIYCFVQFQWKLFDQCWKKYHMCLWANDIERHDCNICAITSGHSEFWIRSNRHRKHRW